MAEDNTWKIVERTCVVIGALGGLGGLAFEALSYFRPPAANNRIASAAHSAAGLPAWALIVLVLFAILLLGTGWAMMIERRRREAVAAAQAASGLQLKGLSEKGQRGFGPNYALWDSREAFSLCDAAYLWVETRPPATSAAAPTEAEAAEAYSMLVDAVRSKKLLKDYNFESVKVVTGQGENHVIPPGLHPDTTVPRAQLIDFANATGQRPKFLFPEER